MTTRAFSENWLTENCRGLTATLERLRIDRQLEETLTRSADPLNLAAVFGSNDTTAIKYATIARQLLEAAGIELLGFRSTADRQRRNGPPRRGNHPGKTGASGRTGELPGLRHSGP